MRAPVVVDTNVAVVANGETPQASRECVVACIDRLATIQREGTVLVDDGGVILEEYRRRLRPPGEPSIGHLFFLWLHDSLGNREECLQIPITQHPDRGFVEFPDAEALRRFERDDRVFVAVAIASGSRPPIVNAADNDWHEHRVALRDNGVDVEFLCPELMRRRAGE